MEVQKLQLSGLLLFKSEKHKDDRGEVFEVYNLREMSRLGLPSSFKIRHETTFKSEFGSIRGIRGGPVQKLCSVSSGAVFCAIVDCRADSESFGLFQLVILEPGDVLFVPEGCGNSALTFTSESVYHIRYSLPWNPQLETIRINPVNSGLNIEWPFSVARMIVTERDQQAPTFQEWADTLK